jgi:hypothetical protein
MKKPLLAVEKNFLLRGVYTGSSPYTMDILKDNP